MIEPAGNSRWGRLFSGLTLVELLVVMSVVSLLMGILIPALGRVRSLGTQLVCQSQLRQWGLAFEVYAGQNDNFYPHIDGRDRTSSDPQTAAEMADYYFGWIDTLPSLMGEKPWREHEYWHRPGVGTIFQCPAATLAPDGWYTYNPMRTGYFSYAMNSCLELDENCWPPHGSAGSDWRMPSFLKTSSIRNPARVILLFDQLLDPQKGYGGTRYNSTAGKYCGSYPKAFSARHAKPRGRLGGSILYDPDWYP
jgi:prepilin-type N-terminal cleavage/methylation domain-containing protein